MEPLESKMQQEKLFQTAIITYQHVFYFRFNQVPQNARLPHPPHPTEIQPRLICFPFRSRGKGWQLGQVPALVRALFATSEALWPSARWLLGLPGSTLLPPRHSLTLQLVGDTEAEQAGEHGRGLGQPGWRGAGGPHWLAAPLPCPSRSAGSLLAARGHSSRLLSGLAGTVLASRQGDRRCQELVPRP